MFANMTRAIGWIPALEFLLFILTYTVCALYIIYPMCFARLVYLGHSAAFWLF